MKSRRKIPYPKNLNDHQELLKRLDKLALKASHEVIWFC